ncbi:lysozyme family protein [Enterococcus hirae]|uniref:lysozyme family protein n=1 Tax=Enterococcus hirae TaxID=1354 RepID=UPI000E070951|nr:lysozyme family protein [Enterococcus hirae]RBT46421.1 hypothetical protein EB20_02681 [Enterococcus hirae]
MIRSWKWKILVIVLVGGGIIGITVSTIEYIQQSVIVLLGGSETQQQSEISTNSNLSEDVLALKSIVEKYAKINGIPDEVPFILAIMMVESGGKGLDPMQSSESAGLAPNAFTSPEQSIKQGVAYYKSCLESAQNLNVTDKKAVIQSYNYGAGFLYWLSKNNKSYSFEAGAEFACQQAGGKKVVYTNPIASSRGNWRYAYGNMFYADLVYQYIENTESNRSEGGSSSYILPVDNPVVSSPFGWRGSPLTGGSEFHRGLDFANAAGSSIKAIASGTVIRSEYHYSWGNHIVIQHDDGKVSLYAHQSVIMNTRQILKRQGGNLKENSNRKMSTLRNEHL